MSAEEKLVWKGNTIPGIMAIKDDDERRRRQDKVSCIKEPVVLSAMDAALMVGELNNLVGGTRRQWMIKLLTNGSENFRK